MIKVTLHQKNDTKVNYKYHIIYPEVHSQFWVRHYLLSISRMEVESAPEILCTQFNRMTTERRNSKTLAMIEYKSSFQ